MNVPGWEPQRGVRDLGLTAGETHAWLLPCVQSTGTLAALSALLDGDERRRAERYHFARDRQRFIAARGALRLVLAGYLGCEPQDVAFVLGGHGKPRIADRHGTPLCFNLSTSQDWALLAVTPGREVGVDVEYIDGRRADREIARRWFAPGEVQALEALEGAAWLRGFFTCWTRKEAFVKATGEGLSRPLDSFEVSVAPGGPSPLLRVLEDGPSGTAWRMTDLPEVPGYATALVVGGPIDTLNGFRLALS